MKHLPARVSEDRARRIVEHGFWWNVFRFARYLPTFRPRLNLSRPLPYLELVWLPRFLIDVELEGPSGADAIMVSVDGIAGHFAIFMAQADVRDAPVDGPAFAPELNVDRVLAHARAGVLNWLLMYQRKRRMTPTGMRVSGLLHCPFWVYYYQRRRGLLDVQIVDAISGERPGSKLKYAIVRAFQRAASGSA